MYCGSNIPRTKDALKTHISRVMFQAAIWRRSLSPIMDFPNLVGHGWIIDKEGKVSIDWMDWPPAPDGLLENIQYACKKGYTTNRCSCHRVNLHCTSLCQCKSCLNSSVVSESGTDSDSASTISGASDIEGSDIDDIF